MTEFEVQAGKFAQESLELQKRQVQLQADTTLFNEKLEAFLASQGLAKQFTLPELVLLACKKARG